LNEANLKHEKGTKALAVAEAISYMPDIKEAFYTKEPSKIIQPIVEKIRRQVDAEFIVVGNRDEVRYSHPNPKRIGHRMVGGDNAAPLSGKAIISESTGTLGPSLRGKAPIFDNGKVIGVVSVGYLQTDIEEEVVNLQKKVLFITILVHMFWLQLCFF